MHVRWVEYFAKLDKRIDAYAIESKFEVTFGTFHSDGLGTGEVSWSNVKVKYGGVTHNITDGSTTDEWIYWNGTTPTSFKTSGSIPSIYETGLTVQQIVGRNVSGTFTAYWPYGLTNEVLNLIKGDINLSSITDNVGAFGGLAKITLTSLDTPFITPYAIVSIILDDVTKFIVNLTKTVSYQTVNIDTGHLEMDGTQVLTTQQAAIADLAGGAALGDVINKVNAILAMLRTHGIIAT